MFTFIHTSDWHLGQNFYGYDRSEEQNDFLLQLADIARKHTPDALLVSGDVFHTAAPSNATVSLYVEGLLNIHHACPTMAIIVIAGNHDSASRLDCDRKLWEACGVTVLGGIGRDGDGCAEFKRHIIKVGDKGIVAAVPFAYPTSFPRVTLDDTNRELRQQAYFQAVLDRANAQGGGVMPVVLMAHLAVTGSDFTGHERDMMMESVNVDVLGQGYDYAALGHIHRPQQVSRRARYCGTPVAVSFDEQCEHSVSIVTIDAHGELPTVETKRIKNRKPLHTIPAGDPVPLDQAITLLQDSTSLQNAYVRMNLLVDAYLPSGSQENLANIVSERGGMFCEIKKTALHQATATVRQMSVREFSGLSPIEVANQYFLDHTGNEMTAQDRELFNQAYQLLQEEHRQ